MFSELKTGKVVGKFILGQQLIQDDLQEFQSAVHKTAADQKELHNFLVSHAEEEELVKIKNSQGFHFHENGIKALMNDVDIWNDNGDEARRIKQLVLTRYGAHPSKQHANERLVKIASRMAHAGKTKNC